MIYRGKKTGCVIAGLVAIVLLLSCQVSAEEQAKDAYQPFMLGEVVVTADSEKKETPATIEEVTAETIERQNASNIGEAIQLLPGVYFREARSKAGYYVTIRGFEQQDVMILLDGVPISVPYEGLVNLPDIPVQNIAKIKVIKGASSTLYGPDAMGGVINIITKKGNEDPSFSASYQAGSNSTHHIEATHGWKVGNLAYFIGGSHRESDGFELADDYKLPDDVLESMESAPSNPGTLPHTPIAEDSGTRDNSDYDRDTLTATMNLEINENNSLGLSMEYYNNEYGIPPVPIYKDHPSGGGTAHWFPRYWRFTDWERYTVNLIEETKIGNSFRIKSRIFYDSYENTLNIYDDDTYSTQDRKGPPSGESIYDDYSAGFSVHMFLDAVSRNSIRLGVSGREDVHEESFQDSEYDRLSSRTWSIALEDEIEVTDRLNVTPGCSYDRFDKYEREQASDPDAKPGDDITAFSPQIGISYDLNDAVNIYGSYARKVRFPTMRNLYADGVVGPQGDPELEEEKADNYEVGCIWQESERLKVAGSVFYSKVEDLINFDNLIGRFEQFEDVDIYGLEFNISGKITDSLEGRLSYTYLQTDCNSSVTITNRYIPPLTYSPDELPYRPEHKVDFDLNQSFGFGMDVAFNGSYISSQTYYNHFDPSDNTVFIAEKKSLDSYILLNLKISQTVVKNVKVNLAVDNLLNEEYETIDMLPGEGRTLWAGIRIDM